MQRRRCRGRMIRRQRNVTAQTRAAIRSRRETTVEHEHTRVKGSCPSLQSAHVIGTLGSWAMPWGLQLT
jgi:hypothetical protein